MIKINFAQNNDIDWMVDLSEIKRLNYEKFQPNFWKKNPDSQQIQRQYFAKLIPNPIFK